MILPQGGCWGRGGDELKRSKERGYAQPKVLPNEGKKLLRAVFRQRVESYQRIRQLPTTR